MTMTVIEDVEYRLWGYAHNLIPHCSIYTHHYHCLCSCNFTGNDGIHAYRITHPQNPRSAPPRFHRTFRLSACRFQRCKRTRVSVLFPFVLTMRLIVAPFKSIFLTRNYNLSHFTIIEVNRVF